MTHSVLVETFRDAYRNSGLYVKNKYGCKDIDETIKAMEKEFDIVSRLDKVWKYEKQYDHYFEFKDRHSYLMFLLRWA